MRAAQAYSTLRELHVPVLRTADAAARWRAARPAASRMLARLAEAGLVHKIAQGLWTLASDLDPLALPPFLTAPHPAYVSLGSALYYHGMISQIPRIIYVVSLARARVAKTALGTYSIHHVPPALFGGFERRRGDVCLAEPEKALIDVLYLSNTRSRIFASLPELDLGADFDVRAAKRWIAAIPNARRRTMVVKRFGALLEDARADASWRRRIGGRTASPRRRRSPSPR